jgi:hypothetical protein
MYRELLSFSVAIILAGACTVFTAVLEKHRHIDVFLAERDHKLTIYTMSLTEQYTRINGSGLQNGVDRFEKNERWRCRR